jgi:SnoaL-like domain/Sigma-70, region 4
VLILRDVLDWPAAEVATLLEIGVAAVNSALQRARATLREHLPPDRREDWTTPAVSAAERALLDGFITTHMHGDAEGALALLADDIRVTMPPLPFLYEGRDAMAPLLEQAYASNMGQWRLVPAAANRQPAAASYLLAPGATEWIAFKIDVLRVAGGKIAEITTFGPTLFEAFGLPMTMAA